MELDNEIFENEDALRNKYLIFSIGEESYGIRIQYVIEIIGIEEITKVPDLPAYVKGIINLRGKIISVMDARIRFKKEQREYDDRTCIIVIEIDNISFGLIVDGVKEVASIEEINIAPPPTVNKQGDGFSGFIEGIGKVENEVWLLIDCMKLLTDPEADVRIERE